MIFRPVRFLSFTTHFVFCALFRLAHINVFEHLQLKNTPSQFSVGYALSWQHLPTNTFELLPRLSLFLWLRCCPATLEAALPDLLNETDFLWEDISAQTSSGTDLFRPLRVRVFFESCDTLWNERAAAGLGASTVHRHWNDGVRMKNPSFRHDVLPQSGRWCSLSGQAETYRLLSGVSNELGFWQHGHKGADWRVRGHFDAPSLSDVLHHQTHSSDGGWSSNLDQSFLSPSFCMSCLFIFNHPLPLLLSQHPLCCTSGYSIMNVWLWLKPNICLIFRPDFQVKKASTFTQILNIDVRSCKVMLHYISQANVVLFTTFIWQQLYIRLILQFKKNITL